MAWLDEISLVYIGKLCLLSLPLHHIHPIRYTQPIAIGMLYGLIFTSTHIILGGLVDRALDCHHVVLGSIPGPVQKIFEQKKKKKIANIYGSINTSVTQPTVMPAPPVGFKNLS